MKQIKFPEIYIGNNFLEIEYEEVSYDFIKTGNIINFIIYLCAKDENGDRIWRWI